MKLYHGTRESAVKGILRQGIKPRGKKAGNWKHTIESNPNFVYLTNAYAIYFAGNATPPEHNERLAVIEIDTAKVIPFHLAPDEDFLEQATRNSRLENLAPIDKPMRYRTRWYRRRLMNFAQHWQDSVKHMGTCTYHGVVPVQAITRIAFIERQTYHKMIFYAGIDPMITMTNYAYVGNKYRNSIKRLFGDTDLEDDPTELHKMKHIQAMPEDQRNEILAAQEATWTNGIEVIHA